MTVLQTLLIPRSDAHDQAKQNGAAQDICEFRKGNGVGCLVGKSPGRGICARLCLEQIERRTEALVTNDTDTKSWEHLSAWKKYTQSFLDESGVERTGPINSGNMRLLEFAFSACILR